MTILSHILGFPRIGVRRELKYALEKYWKKQIGQNELLSVGRELRMRHWKQQRDSGINFISVGDFAWYDHVLSTSLMLGNIPERFRVISNKVSAIENNQKVSIDMLFDIARGVSDESTGRMTVASEMKKWFNTNYHYIVPEFIEDQDFHLSWFQLFDEVDEALSLGYKIKVILLGPISYLWLGRMRDVGRSRLLLLPKLLLVYRKILKILSEKGVEWVQIDEPILVLELPKRWSEIYVVAYKELYGFVKLLLTTYFDSIEHHMDIFNKISVDGLHIDLVSGNDNLYLLHDCLPKDWVLSVGVINGRNIWKADLGYLFRRLFPLIRKRAVWVASSCSLLHVPIDLNEEIEFTNELKGKFSFAVQKCSELSTLCDLLNVPDIDFYFDEKSVDNNVNNNERFHNIDKDVISLSRNSYENRVHCHRKRFCFPLFPTTTIGSFPQTDDLRSARLSFKYGRLDKYSYDSLIKEYIKNVIEEQEKLGLDVLVHGEPERGDMVEYFGEHLNGFVLTCNGWVQSYGSRCVKPPIIIDAITRSKPITVEWITYAQSLTNKPVKGMLTGPITILCWSFPREDVTREDLALQIALAIRDEVFDLEKNGIGIIQIDEPALREGLPLKISSWNNYLSWAVKCFKLVTSVVSDSVQIHTHMCYSEFSDIVDSIIDLDVDVLSIEFSRVDIKSLNILDNFSCFHSVGPGVYDIHSPNIPSTEEVFDRLVEMIKYIKLDRLWVNPDCGLKTRSWEEIRKSLFNIICAVKRIRKIKRISSFFIK